MITTILIILSVLLSLYMGLILVSTYKQQQLNYLSTLDESTINGSFANLSQGRVHYQRFGNTKNNTVVLVHGLLTPSSVWENIGARLVQAGNEVICYDLYGRGYSERVSQPYNEALYNKQLLELLDHLSMTKAVDLVGYSLGGGIATSFTSQYPLRVKKLALIAPAGFMANIPFIAKLAKSPLIGDFLTRFLMPSFTIKRQQQAYQKGHISAEALHRVKQQFTFKGTIESFISTDKHYPYNALESAYKIVEKSKIPISLIWGQDDDLMQFKFSEKVLQAIPSADFHPIVNAKHDIAYVHSDIVTPILVDFCQIK